MDFYEAVFYPTIGMKIARESWPIKGCYIHIDSNGMLLLFRSDTQKEYTWVVSCDDILSTDWVMVK